MATKAKEEGNAAFRRKDYAEAVQCFTRSLTLNSRDYQVLGNRSAALSSLGRWEESLADARAAVAIDPTYVKGFYRQANALLQLGRPAEAAAAATAGLKLQPSNAQMQELLHRATAQMGQMDDDEEEEEDEEEDDDDDDEGEEEDDGDDEPMDTESPVKQPAVSSVPPE